MPSIIDNSVIKLSYKDFGANVPATGLVENYTDSSGFPTEGESGRLYIDDTNNRIYRWSEGEYVEVASPLELGTTEDTAFRGDYGNTAYAHATDSNRLTTAKSSKLYKIATTAEGHVKSVANVQKSDITALGIPESDTTYTFAGGTNKFTVTPAGGSAQTVNVTPSITNNITGTGANGYIPVFNGAHTLTNGPQIGSGTSTFLRNDGVWATPSGGGSQGSLVYSYDANSNTLTLPI